MKADPILNIKQNIKLTNTNPAPCPSCGHIYDKLDHYKLNEAGAWYNCSCGSTRLLLFSMMVEKEQKDLSFSDI